MPEINKGILLDIQHGQLAISERYRVGKSLRSTEYDQVFVLPNSFKSALLPFFARIPLRTGWKGESRYGLLNDLRYLDKHKLPLMVQRFCDLADVAGKPEEYDGQTPPPALSTDTENLAGLMHLLQLDTEKPVLGLCPGAEYGPAKQWPARYYAKLADHHIRQGGQVWIFGSAGDIKVGEQIESGIAAEARSSCVNLTGKTSLLDVIDLISRTSYVVTNDSGLMHIAAALNRPVVVIYGSSSAGFTPPLSDQAESVSLGLECSPCFKRECPLGHTNCLQQLKPEQVVEVLDKLNAAVN
jgi:heptosyltransferase-2